MAGQPFYDPAAGTPDVWAGTPAPITVIGNTIMVGAPVGGGGESTSIGNYSTNQKTMQVLASLADCQEKAGRLLAAANSQYVELTISSPANYLGAFDIVPSLGFYNWGLADALFKRGLSLFGKRLICRSVSSSMVADGTMQTKVTFEIEAVGEYGIEGNYPGSGGGGGGGYPTPPTPPPPVNPPDEIYGGAGAITLIYPGSIRAAFVTGTKTILPSIEVVGGAYVPTYVSVLSPTKAIAVDTDNGYVLDLNLDTITSNAGDAYGTGAWARWSIDRLTNTTAITVHQTYDGFTNYTNYVMVVTVSGSTSTVGTPVKLDAEIFVDPLYTPVYQMATVSAISSTKAIATWFEMTDAVTKYDVYSRILGISGAVVSPGAAYKINDFPTSSSVNNFGQVIALSSTAAVATYMVQLSPTHFDLYVIPIVISGSTITAGTDVLIYSDCTTAPLFGLAKLSSTNFIYVAPNGAAGLRAIAGSMVGGAITLGSSVNLAGSANANYVTCIAKNGLVTVSYADSLGILQRRTLSVTGTVVTDINDATTNGEGKTDYGSLSLVNP